MKVLIAEDNKIHQMVLRDYLSRTQFEVYTANNGEEAWSIWKDQAPEIVVTDINMPKMDGYQLIEQIRNHEIGTYTHIITITSSQDIDELENSFAIGSDDFMVKPIHEKELIFRLRVGERISANLDKKSFFDTLARLTQLRDEDTGGHVNRIAELTRLLSMRMRSITKYENIMTQTYLKNLVLSSILHDIGKIGIDDSLLKSTSIYTPEERMQMQKHTVIGAQLLSEIKSMHPNMGFLDLAISIARSHHEKFDGTGYPDGLMGEEIPLEARIVAVADVFDALVSKRSYKNSFSLEKTLNIMMAESGKQFDPEIIEVFILEIDSIINDIYPDLKRS